MAVYPALPAWGQPAPEWLSLQQAATIYGVSVDTLRRRISAGKLPASRFGVRLIRVRIEDLDRLYRPTPIGDELARRRRS
jgi:excisionase family DNA binding protein